MYKLSKQFACLSACKPAGIQKSLETQIYEELLDLMELAGKIAEIRDSGEQSGLDIDKQNSAYLYVMNLDRQLQTWYRRLPENLVWKPANIQTAPYSFFLLHQQYHCSLILLHRPWARYEEPESASSEDGNPDEAFDNNHAYMSRSICTRQAIRVARIFWHHRQRFSTRHIFVTGIQHAGTAATALVAALAFIKNVNDRKNNMQYLECLATSLSDMSCTYQPAASMSSILQAVMIELQNASAKTPPPDFMTRTSRYLHDESITIPARRESNADDDDDIRIFKKRQFSKSSTRPTPTPTPTPTPYSSGTTTTVFARTPTSSNGAMTFPDQPSSSSDIKHQDGYVMITPRSERAAWPMLNSDLNALDYPMAFTGMNGVHSGMWMDDSSGLDGGFQAGLGGVELDDADVNGNGNGSGAIKNQELDFFQF
jgi:hypothetical protein